jgi:HK97 family phage major capsid protein
MSSVTIGEQEIKDFQQAVAEFRSISAKTGLDEDKISKLESKIFKFEEKNQKLTTELMTLKEEKAGFTERLNQYEKELSRMPLGSSQVKDQKMNAMKAFQQAIQYGPTNVDAEYKQYIPDTTKVAREYKAYMRTDVNSQGAFLVAPPEIDMDIIKPVSEISPLRQFARVKTGSTKARSFRKRVTRVAGEDREEGETVTASNSTYGSLMIDSHGMSALIEITAEELDDVDMDLESEILDDVREEFGEKEDTWFATGDAVTQAEGFLTNSDITVTTSSVSASFSFDDLKNLVGQVKFAYNPAYGFTRSTMADIIQRKDGQGQYLWQPTNSAGAPNTLNGSLYLIMPNMPEIGASNKAVVYADWGRGYCIYDRKGLSVIRDIYSLAAAGKVRLIFMKRLGGGVLQPEAIKILQCGA